MPDVPALVAPPTGATLSAELPARSLLQLGGQDAADRSMTKALTWVLSRFLRKGEPQIIWHPAVHAAALKRAEYELWARAERDDVAKDKKDDANDLLEGYFVGIYDSGASDPGNSEGTGGSIPYAVGAAAAAPVRSPLSQAYDAAQAGYAPFSLWPDGTPRV